MKVNRSAALLLGVVLGVVLVFAGRAALAKLLPLVGGYGLSSPGTASGSCRGTDYVAMLAPGPDDQGISGSIVLGNTDTSWEVRWPGFIYDAPKGTAGGIRPSVDGLVGQAQLVGDRDDGGQRRVLFRPVGEHEWCKATVGLTP